MRLLPRASRPFGRTILCFILLVSVGTFEVPHVWAVTDRIVILKADGVPFDLLDSIVRTRDPQTGKSVLPWIDYVFYQRGVRVRNFYSRGLSLSAPSWGVLDTGQPSVIKGNLEFDRLTLNSYDYLNLLSRVIRSAGGMEMSTPAIDVMDEHLTPVLSDAYPSSERHVGAQVLARRLPNTLGHMRRLLTLQGPKEWLDEWTMGFDQTSIAFEVLQRDLIANLKKNETRYLDFMIPAFDHTVHLSRESEAALHALKEIDHVVGEVWTTIEQGPMAGRTALILVSDHGMNTDSRVYSQGYNLIDLFASAAGGGHHIVTNRPPLGDYTLKSLSPVMTAVTTESPASYYLKGQTENYPTLLLDADGNERASVYLRDSELNLLQILWQQLTRKDLSPELSKAARNAFFAALERNRPRWTLLADQLTEELADLNRRIVEGKRFPVKNSPRSERTFNSMEADQKAYGSYLVRLKKLLALRPDSFNPSRLKVEDVIAPKSMGATNSVHDLQNYVAGLAAGGMVLNGDGSLDMKQSFTFVNYFEVLAQIRSRNNVQASVASNPVDFIATAIPIEVLAPALADDAKPADIAVLLYKDDAHQLLILGRRNSKGEIELRCLPVRHLMQSGTGNITFSIAPWAAGFPLQIWESLPMPADTKQPWLESWRGEREWFEATHAGEYSNAVVSLYEQFAFSPNPASSGPAGSDVALLGRFHDRKRLLAQSDFIIFASDHWNFNYRDFNPGGNHGAFFRKSTQATLMFAGGPETGIPQGLVIDRPYDTLSFIPTVFTLTGDLTDELSLKLQEKGFRPFPGPIIRELFEGPADALRIH